MMMDAWPRDWGLRIGNDTLLFFSLFVYVDDEIWPVHVNKRFSAICQRSMMVLL